MELRCLRSAYSRRRCRTRFSRLLIEILERRRTHYDDGNARSPQNLVGNASQQEPRQTAPPVSGHGNQIHRMLLGVTQNRGGGIYPQERLRLDIDHFSPKEVVFPASAGDALPRLEGCVRSPLDDWVFNEDSAMRVLRDQFGTASLDGFGCTDKPLAMGAAGALVYYARKTQRSNLEHITGFRCDQRADYMILDADSIRNLELLVSSGGGGTSETLLGVMDRTATGMGSRLLRNWMIRPSIDRDAILQRQDGIEELVGSQNLLDELMECFDGMAEPHRP